MFRVMAENEGSRNNSNNFKEDRKILTRYDFFHVKLNYIAVLLNAGEPATPLNYWNYAIQEKEIKELNFY